MNPLILSAGVVLAMSACMAAGWVFQRARRNGGWTDAFWSYSVGAVGVAAALYPMGEWAAPSLRQLAVAGLVALWSLRLGGHIAHRAAEGLEDARYAELRREWGGAFDSRMFVFLQVQALSGAFLIAAIALAAHQPAPGLRIADFAGFILLALSILGEGIADRQLRRFRAYPANRGRVCDVGLWSWSRHPNYFFEWLGWVAYAVVAVDLTGAYAVGWLALSGPAFIYYLLRHVSGVPLLEASMIASRGDAYRDYQARVSPFFPLPPKPSITTGDVTP